MRQPRMAAGVGWNFGGTLSRIVFRRFFALPHVSPIPIPKQSTQPNTDIGVPRTQGAIRESEFSIA